VPTTPCTFFQNPPHRHSFGTVLVVAERRVQCVCVGGYPSLCLNLIGGGGGWQSPSRVRSRWIWLPEGNHDDPSTSPTPLPHTAGLPPRSEHSHRGPRQESDWLLADYESCFLWLSFGKGKKNCLKREGGTVPPCIGAGVPPSTRPATHSPVALAAGMLLVVPAIRRCRIEPRT
jgi:hypothetical protein